MLWGYCGLLGSGKTTGLVAQLRDFKNEGYEIRTYGVKTTLGDVFNIDELLNFELNNCAIGISEAYTILDSRVNSVAERNISYFFLQSRKRNVHVVYDAQLMSSIDLRLRFITDKVILCQRDWNEEWKKNPETGVNEPVIYGFIYSCFDRGEILTSQKYIRFDVAMKDVFPLFNSQEIVMPMQLQDSNITMDKLQELFDDCTTKDSFVSIMKSEHPFISLQTCKSVYDLMNMGKLERVARLLRIKDIPKDESIETIITKPQKATITKPQEATITKPQEATITKPQEVNNGLVRRRSITS